MLTQINLTMKNLIILLACFCFCSCSRQKPTETKKLTQTISTPHSFFNIKYEDILNSKDVIKLSQIASNIEYVQLQTKRNSMLGKGLLKYIFTDEFIFVQDYNRIMKFSRKGKFLKQIGTPGTESGQIDIIRGTYIIPDKELICVQTSRRKDPELLFFSFDGKLQKTLTYKQLVDYKPLAENTFILYDEGHLGNNKTNFVMVNEKMDTISYVKNYITFELPPQEERVRIVYPSFDPFCNSINNLYLKSMYCDTVYSVISDKIEPAYFIDLGKNRLPDTLRFDRLNREEMKKLGKKINDYYFANAIQTPEKIFLTVYSYGEAPSKCVLFDKKTQQGKLVVNDQGASKGFVNDLDGGIDFWPRGMISDNQLFMPIRIPDIKKQLTRISSNKSVKFPDKQQKLVKMIEKSNNIENPIVMIVTVGPDK